MKKGIRQHYTRDCSAACLASILLWYGADVPLIELRQKMRVDKNGASILAICKTASLYGLDSEGYYAEPEEFFNIIANESFKLPVIVHTILDNHLQHYVVVKKYYLKVELSFLIHKLVKKHSGKKSFKESLLGSVLFFFYRLFHSIFAFSPKRENTIVYTVTLVFLDLQGLLASLIVYEWHEHEILQFVLMTISANFDKYAISYDIFILICVELLGLINYCALATMRKLEMYTARNQFKMNMKKEDIPANYMEPVERDLDYDWNYINNFCWLMILGLMVLLFAIAVFSPKTLFLENKDSQSAFINVVALVSLIILIFDKRSSWLLNRNE